MATLFLIILTSFVGSAPGSTGSGIKVTTLAIFIAIVRAAISGTTDINIKSRRIAKDQVNKAIAILSLSVLWVIGTIFCLLITHAQYSFLSLVFEAFSAFAALGISLGVTPFLTSFGKLIIMASMIIGRIGSLTLILALRKAAHRRQMNSHEFTYPEERVMLS
jgi:Trk-type K+ transport system membrane component